MTNKQSSTARLQSRLIAWRGRIAARMGSGSNFGYRKMAVALRSGLDGVCRGLNDRRELACAGLLLCGVAVAAHAAIAWRDIDHLQREYGNVASRLDDAQARLARERRLTEASARAKGSVSLVKMLGTMERAWHPDIALLQWRADAGQGRATAVFRATSVDAAFGLVERLHNEGARHARLLRQQAAEQPDGQWRIDATVMVEW